MTDLSLHADPAPPMPAEPSGDDPAAAAAIVDISELCWEATRGFTLRIEAMHVRRGERVAVVGHNGAGKSCLLECLAGHNRARARRATLLGRPLADVAEDRKLKRRMGVQLQRNAFPPGAPVRDLVALHRALYGCDNRELLEALAIGEIRRRDYGVLSRGQKQRIDLYMALAHRPELALLDEPSTGLDAGFAGQLGGLLRARDDGATIMATHDEAEISAATHIFWLADGKVVASGPRDEVISAHLGSHKLDLNCLDEASAARCEARIGAESGLRHLLREGPSVRAFGDRDFEPVAGALRDEVQSYTLGRVGLADFLALVARRSS